jgi:membrane protein implicated in regulation of membrane protease activity
MIQRLQSVFLLLCAGSMAALFKFPLASSDVAAPQIFEDKLYTIDDNPVLLGMVLAAILVALGAIFLYKNRSLQIKFVYILITLCVLLIILTILLVFLEGTQTGIQNEISEGIGIAFPGLSIIFAWLAHRFIRKDDKLVKSMDRLR